METTARRPALAVSGVGTKVRAVLSVHRVALAGIVCLSLWLVLNDLADLGWANVYYAATVRGMLASPSNLFFGAFDPGGFITVDKPPAGFWIQALSAALLGYNGISLLLPQALAAVASVVVLYAVVSRSFGVTAGLLAALALAVTPISVATARDNTVDGLLVLVLLLAAWALLKAAESGSWRWLAVAAALVGLGFNVKMLEAWLVVPAFAVTYLLAAPRSVPRRLGHLAAAAVVLVAVSLSWAVAVQLTPADLRPFVGGSTTNSAIELAFDYNGLERLNGGIAFPDTGSPGILRLFQDVLAGQLSWLIPLGLIGLAAVFIRGGWRAAVRRVAGLDRSASFDRRAPALAMWIGWFLTAAIFFSVARFWHPYYLVVLAPSVAALAGIGGAALWQRYAGGGVRGWLLPIAVAVTAVVQLVILRPFGAGADPVRVLLAVFGLGAAGALVCVQLARSVGRVVRTRRAGVGEAGLESSAATAADPDGMAGVPRPRHNRLTGMTRVMTAAGIGALLVAPAAWSAYTATHPVEGALPSGGPPVTTSGAFPFGLFGGSGGPGGPGGAGSPPPEQPAGFPGFGTLGGRPFGNFVILGMDSPLAGYLAEHRGSERWILVTLTATEAAPLIIGGGLPVMAIGGFTGSDRAIDVGRFAALVATHQVRYVLGGPTFNVGGSGAVMRWAQEHCAVAKDAPVPNVLDCSTST